MKKNTYKRPALLRYLLLAIIAMQFSCSEDVDLPMPFVKTDKSVIIASAGETTIDLLVESNWEWALEIDGENASWLSTDASSAIGNLTIKLHIKRNAASTRSALIKVISKKNNSVQTSVEVKQYSYSETNSIPISEIRKLASNITGNATEYKINEDLRIRGNVVSNILTANLEENSLAMQDGYDENSGIKIVTQDNTWFDMGEDIQVSIKGAILKKNQDGIIQLLLESDDKISKTASTITSPQPVEITYEELISGKYESMYVGIPSVQVQDISSDVIMEGSITVQDIQDNRLCIRTTQVLLQQRVFLKAVED